MNRKYDQFDQPLNCACTFLTYIEGTEVEGWKQDQLDQLIKKTNCAVNPLLETDEDLWTDLLKDFKEAFTNTNIKSDTYTELKRLKQGESLNKYIAEFKCLVHLTEIPIDNHGIIKQFKEGLKSGLTKAIIASHDYAPAITWTFNEWAKNVQKQHGKWKAAQLYGRTKTYNTKREALKQYFKIGSKGTYRYSNCHRYQHQGHCTTSQGGDAMDIDTFNSISPEEKAARLKSNTCFYCRKVGHHTAVCRKKAHNRGLGNSPNPSTPTSSNSQCVCTTNTNNAPDYPLLKPKEVSKLIATNMDKFNDEEKEHIMEALVPQNFQTAQN